MMKQICLLILCFIGSYSGANSQNIEKDTTAIKGVIIDFFELFSQDDLKYLERNCTPDFELYEVGTRWTNDTLINLINKRKAQKKTWERTNEFNFISFKVQKNIAWVGYYNTAHLTNITSPQKRKVKWLESAILVKKKRKWWLVQMHSTALNR